MIYTATDTHELHDVLSVTPDEVQTLYKEAKTRSIKIESYFGKEYVPAVQSKAEQSKTDAIASDSATATASIRPESSDESLEYSAELMHAMIRETLLNIVEQLSESPRWLGASREAIERIAAEHQNAYSLADGQLYSKAQVRELFVCICRSCIDAFVAPPSESTK